MKNINAFTLAEVLITLAIIGVVAAITIPILNNSAQDTQYKTAYRKAYSDMSNAMLAAISEQSLTPRTAGQDTIATDSEYTTLKNAFSVNKACTVAQLETCWIPGEYLTPGSSFMPTVGNANSFIDASGRAWAEYSVGENIYLVDTNGSKQPNRYGKDRWIFTLRDADNTRTTSGFPAKVGMYTGLGDSMNDVITIQWSCHYPPCNYQSWLIGY